MPGGTNQTRARELYERAAGVGLPEGQFNLAVIHHYGLGGVARNLTRAAELYALAVEGAPIEEAKVAPYLALQVRGSIPPNFFKFFS